MEIGDTFTVGHAIRELFDPASGIVLGKIEEQLVQAQVEQVMPTCAVARIVGNFPINRGDLLHQ